MSAGTGVRHSEFNASADTRVHFLQIWIEPNARGVQPGYEEKDFPASEKRGRLRVIASPDGREGSVTIHQDASVLAAVLGPGDAVTHEMQRGRRVYVHVARGSVTVNDQRLAAGDGVRIENESGVRLTQAEEAEVLVFDLP